MAPCGAMFRVGPLAASVIVMMMVPDDHLAVAIAMRPAAVPAAIMFTEFRARSAIVPVTIIIAVAADMNAKLGGACNCRGSNCDGRERGQHVRQLPHGPSPSWLTGEQQMASWSVAGTGTKLS